MVVQLDGTTTLKMEEEFIAGSLALKAFRIIGVQNKYNGPEGEPNMLLTIEGLSYKVKSRLDSVKDSFSRSNQEIQITQQGVTNTQLELSSQK